MAVQVPNVNEFEGAVLLADITGFTSLTEHISQIDKAGVEILTNCMNSYFSQIIDLVHHYQGDVMRFAGDSVICAFKPKGDDLHTEDKGLRKATAAAVECASAMSFHLGILKSLNRLGVSLWHALVTNGLLKPNSSDTVGLINLQSDVQF